MSSNEWKNHHVAAIPRRIRLGLIEFFPPLNEKLTLGHFDIDSAAKMPNHLAEDVLDRKMLFLKKVFFMVKQLFPPKLKTVFPKACMCISFQLFDISQDK